MIIRPADPVLGRGRPERRRRPTTRQDRNPSLLTTTAGVLRRGGRDHHGQRATHRGHRRCPAETSALADQRGACATSREQPGRCRTYARISISSPARRPTILTPVIADQPAAGILDTSVFIASETNRQLNTSLIPEQVATTVITLAELNAGVRWLGRLRFARVACGHWTLSLT